MTNEPKAWERQPWDTDTSFDRFQRYYLVQDPPRSVNEAYRQYRRQKGHKPASNKLAPGIWNAWSQGRKFNNKTKKYEPIPNALSWPERAAAWDDHLARLRQAEWERQHMPPAEVIARLSAIARGDIGEFAKVIALSDLEEHEKSELVQAIQSHTDERKDGSIKHNFKFKLYSKLDALEKLARHYGLFDDKLDITSAGEQIKFIFGGADIEDDV